MNTFFSTLEPISDLRDLCQSPFKQKLPSEWQIFVVDVRGSTQAIEEGKYKSVNSVGVAAIAAVLNAAGNTAIPYVFGGDGATFCVPKELFESVRTALLGAKKMAIEAFDLELIVGAISIEDIRSAGRDIDVGRYKTSEHFFQATFSGGGISYAESVIKNNHLGYQFEMSKNVQEVNFQGFECRWQNIPSPYGETVAYLIKSDFDSEDKEIYQRVLEQFEVIYGSPQKRHPLNPKKMKLSFKNEHYENESRIKTFLSNSKTKYLKQMWVQNLIGAFCMCFKIRYHDMAWGKYKERAIENSDTCKFDDMLRLVVSGNSEQRAEMESFLEKNFSERKLAYGLHVSNAAMMTCYVKDYVSNHFHFIDGADGGYALAAVDLKKRITRLESKKIN